MRQLRPLPGTPYKTGKPMRHKRGRRRHPLLKSALFVLATATPLASLHEPAALRTSIPTSFPRHEAAANPAKTDEPARQAFHEKASSLVFAQAVPLPAYGLPAIGAPILRAGLAPALRQVAEAPAPAPLPPVRILASAEPQPAPEPSIPLPPIQSGPDRIVPRMELAEAPLPPERIIPLRKPEATPRPARARARIRTASIVERTPAAKPESFFEKLFGQPRPNTGPALAYAPASEANQAMPSFVERPRTLGSRTAIYNIAAHVVIMPDGQRLEAHSGLGSRLDNPHYVSEKDRGPTPPNVYNLQLRRQLFHGVQAIRLNPQNPSRMFGRDGILAHTYMLGPRGDSNGCISFRDYRAFLKAFLRGEVTRIIVVKDSSSLVAENT